MSIIAILVLAYLVRTPLRALIFRLMPITYLGRQVGRSDRGSCLGVR